MLPFKKDQTFFEFKINFTKPIGLLLFKLKLKVQSSS
jgi:hypothetical protein